ncbi:GTPase [Tundrisphaera sp. TA3]|uniref:GTPase n=1 Tax=Tundrisphaera sp. TA3 TaxID=3435775 RepID=UPI003EC0B19E
MRKNWRYGVLLALFLGPYLAFMGLGFLWLTQQGWMWASIAGLISILTYIAFSLLLVRWTKSSKSLLPPIDWEAPSTFSAFDRQALALVEAEAEFGDTAPMAALTSIDTYIDTGRRLAARLSAHYNPLSSDPLDRVSVVEMLTALELASEDLARLCRQIPGGDLVTPGDWKKAVVAANYIQKASDIYTYLLPLFNPITGLPRLASQQLMVKPAWKSMQQNALRWFYRAYVNRLGTHFIELFSGRLVIGADRYRRLTKHGARPGAEDASEFGELTIALVGARDSGKSRLIERLEAARLIDPPGDPSAAPRPGGDPTTAKRIKTAKFVEVESYHATAGKETARDRSTRRHAVADAVAADLLILVIDARANTHETDANFIRDWDKWYTDHPGLEPPPAIAVLTHVDDPVFGPSWNPPYNWATGKNPREVAIHARAEGLKMMLAPRIEEVIPVAIGGDPPFGVDELLASLRVACRRAERVALIRHLHEASTRSKAGRLVRQIGEHGQSLWKHLRDPRGGNSVAKSG